MDERSFGELSKRVAAAAESRRSMLGAAVTGITASLGFAIVREDSAEAAFGYCRSAGFACGKDHQCCTGKCLEDGTCSCAKKGKPCINRVGINCCSRKCKKGKCR